MKAAKHPLQERRIDALRSYGILDTEREPEFDDVAKLAAEICEAPISVVNFIDHDRQWFKAETGLGMRETPIATSICSHVILEQDFVEIADTLVDPRMADNPLCCGDPGLRFYAGALLKTDEGLPLGTLCILDYQPRTLTDLQRRTIQVLAAQVMAQLDLRRALREAELLRREVDHRVKNSLQSIESLARIAARDADDPAAKEAISAMGRRIASVAQVHDMLYQTNAGNSIMLHEYIDHMADAFRDIAPQDVALISQVDPVTVTSKQAGSLGLLINEFVSNSFKHAFPNGRTGQVTITGRATPGNRLRLTLEDNGVGLSDDKLLQTGLGMIVVKAVCAQLECDADIQNTDTGLTMTLDISL